MITRIIENADIQPIAKRIFALIKSEPKLTARELEDIVHLIKRQNFSIALDEGGDIAGFIAAEQIYKNYYELKSWYVLPALRGGGLAQKLFHHAVSDRSKKYIAATFQINIVRKVQQFGLVPIRLRDLPLPVIFYYLATRQWSSYIRFFTAEKTFFLGTL